MNQPEPPVGYRLLTDEEKKQPLPMDALAYLGEEWLPSRAAGRLAGKSDQRETTYATRLAAIDEAMKEAK